MQTRGGKKVPGTIRSFGKSGMHVIDSICGENKLENKGA